MTLDNTGSAVDVGYQVTNIGSSPSGKEPWATAKPSSDVVAARSRALLTLTPATDLCSQLQSNQVVTFSADIKLTSGGSGTTTITDSITPYIIG